MIAQKLTPEESSKRLEFIGMCIDKNVSFPSNSKFGAVASLTIQDLVNSNITTLAKIASSIKKAASDHDPEFSGNEALKIGGVEAEKWLDFFRYTIRKKRYDQEIREKKERMKELTEKIDLARTPEELRKEAEAELETIRKDLE